MTRDEFRLRWYSAGENEENEGDGGTRGDGGNGRF